ncbi:MAG: hypothetical protein WA939_19635 [Nodosilinea sp.]
MTTIQQPDAGDALKQAVLSGELRLWTEELTQVLVTACRAIGWQASAKGYPIPAIPVNTSEFLSLDVAAFEPSDKTMAIAHRHHGAREPGELNSLLSLESALCEGTA